MKPETFIEYLQRFCFELHPKVLEDVRPYFFDQWSERNVEQIIRLGQLYGNAQYVEGMREILNKIK